MSEIEKKLKEDLADSSWQDLIPHAKRDAVIVVDSSLDLLEVGKAIAVDNKVLVSSWIEQNLLSKPSSSQLMIWNNNPQQQFTTSIVQPFVIIQEING